MPRSHVSLPYGAAELKAYEPRALLMSFGLSALLVPGMLTLAAALLVPGGLDAPPPITPRDRIIDIGGRIPWIPTKAPTGSRPAGKIVSAFAIPIPVPIRDTDTTVFFPTTADLGQIPGDAVEPGDGFVGIAVPVPVEIEPRPFEPREVDPVVVRSVKPAYPRVAVQAGLEGNVYVRVWVDTGGLVRKAEIMRSDGEIFDEPALEAVRQWVFTPALMQSRPVGVWVTIPIRFRLREKG